MTNHELKIRILEHLDESNADVKPTVKDVAESLGLEFGVVKDLCAEMRTDEQVSYISKYGAGGNGVLRILPAGREQLVSVKAQSENHSSDVNVQFNQSNVAIGGSSVEKSNITTGGSGEFPWGKSILASIIAAIIIGIAVHVAK